MLLILYQFSPHICFIVHSCARDLLFSSSKKRLQLDDSKCCSAVKMLLQVLIVNENMRNKLTNKKFSQSNFYSCRHFASSSSTRNDASRNPCYQNPVVRICLDDRMTNSVLERFMYQRNSTENVNNTFDGT